MLTAQTKKLVKVIYEACHETKAVDLIGLDMSHIQSYADFIFIMTATSSTQAGAIVERIKLNVKKKLEIHPLGIEGLDSTIWMLADYGDVICHIFLDEARDLYRLEHMWPRVTPMKDSEIKEMLSAKKKSETKSDADKKPKKAKATSKTTTERKVVVKKVIKRKSPAKADK